MNHTLKLHFYSETRPTIFAGLVTTSHVPFMNVRASFISLLKQKFGFLTVPSNKKERIHIDEL